MRCPINHLRRASARLAQAGIGGEQEEGNAQPLEQPQAIVDAEDEVMAALSDDQVRIVHCLSFYL